MTFPIEALSSHHDRAKFSSGVDALDTYLKTQAGQDVRRRVASCFVAYTADRTVVGYHTLSATGVSASGFPPDQLKKLPRYAVVPATLLGRLAVDNGVRGQGLGESLLFDAFKRALRSEIATYALMVDAINESAAAFYLQYGFLRMLDAPNQLLLPLSKIASFFDRLPPHP